MKYYLAVDSGGTKTEAVVHDEAGHVIGRRVTPGCNAMDVGAEEAARRITDALEGVRGFFPDGKPDKSYFGLASKNYYEDRLIGRPRELYRDWNITWEDDGRGMITSVLGRGDGGCIVCGTGSSMFCRRGGEMFHTGGWGYLLDTVGSGFMLGRDAIRAALRQYDGRGEKTLLYESVSVRLGARPEKSIPEIYAGGRPFIASFARCVFECRAEGDAVAGAIFDHNASALAEMTFAGERFYGKPFRLVLSGGILMSYPEYADRVREEGSRTAEMIRAEIPPVYGCALENVMSEDGFDEAEFRKNFNTGLAAARGRRDN